MVQPENPIKKTAMSLEITQYLKASLAIVLVVFFTQSPIHAFELSNSQNNDPFSTIPTASNNDFLPVETAFSYQINHDEKQQRILINWEIAPGYYLYKDRIAIETTNAAITLKPNLPKGVIVDDPEFGNVEVYYGNIHFDVNYTPALKSSTEFELQFQGCAEAGLCYPPQKKRITFSPENVEPTVVTEPNDATPTEPIGNNFKRIFQGNSFIKIIFLFFIAGIGLTFTPCVLPMIPILSSIIVGQKAKRSRSNAFLLSLAYVAGMSLTYALIGTLMGYFGAKLNIQAYMQNPIILIFSAAIFVLLALSMFGFYDLALPGWLNDRINRINQKQQGGNYISVILMGVLSSLVVSPCISAPLSGALIYISSTGDPIVGGAALLALGLGMGVPLLIIGTTEGQLLPKAGPWMHGIKAAFGVLLLGIAIYLLERILPGSVTLVLWAILCIGSATFLGALDFSPKKGIAQFWKAIGFVLLTYWVVLLIGAASGQTNPFRPLSGISSQTLSSQTTQSTPIFKTIYSLQELDQTLAVLPKKLTMIDIYADWCRPCKIIEKEVFQHATVIPQLQRLNLIKLDMTQNSPENRKFLSKFNLFGPPSVLFFDANDEYLPEFSLQGEFNRETFQRHLKQLDAISNANN